MTAGVTPNQADLWRGSAGVVGDRLAPESVWVLLHREGHRLFPDAMFEDLFSSRGRRSVPPQVVAVVMVLQRLFGLSDREAVEAFEFDVRWKFAAGGLDLDFPGFSHTVLVAMRARLAESDRPRRIFEVTLGAAKEAGLVGHRRVLDSTPLYDAVATMDTVTLVRSAIRGLLAVADDNLELVLRAGLVSGDDYGLAGKPRIDWDDQPAREQLIDAVARDGIGCLRVLEGRAVTPLVADAAELLATVLGQDLVEGDDGVFRIVWGVAPDRVISTVDPDTRHGHKTAARGFDGYKGHIAIDPDSEIITDTTVTPGNVGDGEVAENLIRDLTDSDDTDSDDTDSDDPDSGDTDSDDTDSGDNAGDGRADTASDNLADSADGEDVDSEDVDGGRDDSDVGDNADTVGGEGPKATDTDTGGGGVGGGVGRPVVVGGTGVGGRRSARGRGVKRVQRANQKLRAKTRAANAAAKTKVYGDSAYGSGSFQQHLTNHGIDSRCRTQRPAPRPNGLFNKDLFIIDLDNDTVTCPAGDTADIDRTADGDGTARFDQCNHCPMRANCTTSTTGRTIKVGVHEPALAEARHAQTNPEWQDDYRAVRPKVERKIGHLMLRRHGGRRARVRGNPKVDADFNLLAAAHNIRRLATLEASTTNGQWTTA